MHLPDAAAGEGLSVEALEKVLHRSPQRRRHCIGSVPVRMRRGGTLRPTHSVISTPPRNAALSHMFGFVYKCVECHVLLLTRRHGTFPGDAHPRGIYQLELQSTFQLEPLGALQPQKHGKFLLKSHAALCLRSAARLVSARLPSTQKASTISAYNITCSNVQTNRHWQ